MFIADVLLRQTSIKYKQDPTKIDEMGGFLIFLAWKLCVGVCVFVSLSFDNLITNTAILFILRTKVDVLPKMTVFSSGKQITPKKSISLNSLTRMHKQPFPSLSLLIVVLVNILNIFDGRNFCLGLKLQYLGQEHK